MVFVRETQQTQQQLTQKKNKQHHFWDIYIYHYISSQERTTKNTPLFFTLGEKTSSICVLKRNSTRTSPWQIQKMYSKDLMRPATTCILSPVEIYLWFVWYMGSRPSKLPKKFNTCGKNTLKKRWQFAIANKKKPLPWITIWMFPKIVVPPNHQFQ